MSNTRINGIEQIETALRNLEAYGYDTASVWAEHNAWLRSMDTRPPSEFDAVWATRNEKPSSIEEHFVQLLKFPVYADPTDRTAGPIGWREEKEYGPELLTAANCFPDRQFTLTPGMRDTLRERHGLTPAKHVVVTHAAMFPNTNIVWQFTIKSAEHVDPRRRRHVLIEAVITPASEFFNVAAQRDREREAEKEQEDAKRVKKGEEPRTAKMKALQYFE